MARPTRAAFTLTEILIVVALILVIAAISVPALQDMYSESIQSAAVDAVRAAWSDARVHAINEGRPYRFGVIKGKGNFRVAPDGADYWSGGEGPGASDDGPAPWVLQETLPKGIRFADGTGSTEGGDDRDSSLPVEQISTDQWTPVVTFLPDGTSNVDVEVMFQSKNARPMVLRLRAMTGSVTAARVSTDAGP